VDVRIAHTVAYLLRCHGATGDDVDDDDDDAEILGDPYSKKSPLLYQA